MSIPQIFGNASDPLFGSSKKDVPVFTFDRGSTKISIEGHNALAVVGVAATAVATIATLPFSTVAAGTVAAGGTVYGAYSVQKNYERVARNAMEDVHYSIEGLKPGVEQSIDVSIRVQTALKNQLDLLRSFEERRERTETESLQEQFVRTGRVVNKFNAGQYAIARGMTEMQSIQDNQNARLTDIANARLEAQKKIANPPLWGLLSRFF